MKVTFEQREKHYLEAIEKLEPLGWVPLCNCLFFKNGKVYDLSAADLDKIDQIEKDGLFIVTR